MNIYISVSPYLKEFCIHHFAVNDDVIELPYNSPEYKLLRRFIDRKPEDVSPDDCSENLLGIKIPEWRDLNPRQYNYLCPAAKKALSDSLDHIMSWSLWTDLRDLSNVNVDKTQLVRVWLDRHGITATDEAVETFRQRYYRFRKTYGKKSLNLA